MSGARRAATRDPGEYTVGMILRLTEGDLAPVNCVGENPVSCDNSENCALAKVWSRVNDAVNQVVDNITLADLLDWQTDYTNQYMI